MYQGAKIAHLLEELKLEIQFLSQQTLDIEVRDNIDENHNGDPAATVIIALEDGEEYAMYSTSSVAGLQSYLRGFTHAVKAAAGTYAFKPLTEAARRRKIETMLPVVRDGRAAQFREVARSLTRQTAPAEYLGFKERPSAATSPRFAHWRTRFRED